MNARLIKETRDLLPFFGGTLVLIILPHLAWRDYAFSFGYAGFGVACAVLGGASFGSEFQHRTLGLLLSQPIDRAVLWREKMLVLGAALGMSLGVLLVCLRVTYPGLYPQWWGAALIALCAFCGAPYWTLLLRQGLGGMAFAAAVPVLLGLTVRLVTDRLVENPAVQGYPVVGVLLIYCALVHGLGYSRFRRLQVVEGGSRELALPAGLEFLFIRPLSRVSARIHGQFASLLRKEFRLQQTSFMLAGLFVVIAATGACAVWSHSDWGEAIVGGDYIIYVLILPFIAGATSVAEEKGWDLAEWHLTLPPSALKQWSAKMLAALSTSLALGLVLPVALVLAAEALFTPVAGRDSLPPVSQAICWVLGQLFLTSVAVYAASFSSTTLKAILAAFAITTAGCAVCALVIHYAAETISPMLVVQSRAPDHPPYIEAPSRTLVPLLIAGGMFLILCLIHWFAWSNFRRVRRTAGEIVVQLLGAFAALAALGLATTQVIFSVVSRWGW